MEFGRRDMQAKFGGSIWPARPKRQLAEPARLAISALCVFKMPYMSCTWAVDAWIVHLQHFPHPEFHFQSLRAMCANPIAFGVTVSQHETPRNNGSRSEIGQ
jgi:hypothetical protein